MAPTCKQFVHIILAVTMIRSSINSYAQSTELDPQKWAIQLNKKGKVGNESYRIIDSILEHLDSSRTFEFLNKLADKGKKSFHFEARFNCLKAHQICLVGYNIKNRITADVLARKTEIQNMLAYAIDQAYRSEDDHLIAQVSYSYGQTMIHFGEVGLAGEVRPVQRGQERLKEAAKLGFTRAIVPKANAPRQAIKGIEVIAVDRLEQALSRV